MPKRKKTLRWRSKLLLLLITFSVLPVAAFAFWATRTVEDTFRTSTLDGLQALASAKAEAIDQFTAYRRTDVERIATLLAPYVAELHDSMARARAAGELPGPDELLKLPDDRLPNPDPAPVLSDAGLGHADGGTGSASWDRGGSSSALPGVSEGHRSVTDPADATARQHAPARERTLSREEEEALTKVRQPLGLILWDQNQFEELLVIDTDGRVLVSTYAEHKDRSAAEVEYFQQGSKATFVQPVYESPITKGLTMVIATPIYNQERKLLGVLAVRLNLRRFFRLIGDQTGLGKTGETVVGKKVDSEVVFMAPTRHNDQAALKVRIPIDSDRAQGLQDAARGQSGSGLTQDYRGVHVLAAWQHVPSLDWGLLVKIDYDEAIRSANEAKVTTLLWTLVILIIAIIAAFVVSQAFVRPLQEFKEATDRISRGDLDVQLNIRSHDEIGELADSFERMVAAIKFFRERSRGSDEDEGEDGDGDEESESTARGR
jgi:HAMP domain-containing protein